ncbi:dipeptidase [Pararhodobacter sp.]|uniref:dipeptidase n=1 Tax=Pararhodobacter sp. TaxID=2127056 RepID=UPI002AFE6A15|nr:membrane dipeptidase [Pararhodobacter sp.]
MPTRTPGRTFLRDAEGLSFLLRLYRFIGGTYEEDSLADMAAGGMAAAVVNGVGDIQVITLGDGGLTSYRGFEPDEAWESYRRQITNLQALAGSNGVSPCLTPDDVLAAHAQGRLGIILAMEGADALNGDARRVAQMYADGVRMLTLVHYRDNEIGHIMTGDGGGGLPDAGREIVAAMNEWGMMIDLAHAAEATAFDVIGISQKPVILSHTHINAPALSHPRFISPELAQAVADTGGYIGAWPAGIGIDSLDGFADRVLWLIEQLGEDHVALGSDMDANYRPVLETYRKMPLLVGALMRRGVGDATLRKVLGGNVLRVWGAVQAP